LPEVTEEERKRAHARSRRMFETDMTSNILTAEDNVRMEIVRSLKAKGIPIEEIADSTKLTVDEILKLGD